MEHKVFEKIKIEAKKNRLDLVRLCFALCDSNSLVLAS